jgi:hypothetical protein
MTVDRRRLKLWGILALSTMFTTYQLVFNRPDPRGVPVGQAPQPSQSIQTDPGTSAAPGTPAAQASAEAAGPAPPLPAADFTQWRAALPPLQRDPFFTAAELDAMGRPPAEAPVPVAPPAPLPAYTVKVVLMQGSEGRALIGDDIVEVGDRLGEERVAEILPDAVVLEGRGARRRLAVAGSKPVQITLERTR